MRHRPTRLLVVEILEDRWVPASIDFYTVALHELGHSLGLTHSTSSACGAAGQPVMCPYYLGPVTRLQQEDIDRINVKYPETLGDAGASGRWDVKNADGSARAITFSYVAAGVKMDKGGNSTALPASWPAEIVAALAEWTRAADTNGTATRLTFANVPDGGQRHNFCDGTPGNQGSPNFGDIRFAAHRFDGPGNVLAHAYYPPPNGCSQAGDAHFDNAEQWDPAFTARGDSSPGNSDRGLEYMTLAPSVPAAAIVIQPDQAATDTTRDLSVSASQSLIETELSDQSPDALSQSESSPTGDPSVPSAAVRVAVLDDLTSGREGSADQFGLYDLLAGDIADLLF